MNGPQHYVKSEQHLRDAAHAASLDNGEEIVHLLYAQVHACLAGAAATAMAGCADMHRTDFEAWDAVCGVPTDDNEDPRSA